MQLSRTSAVLPSRDTRRLLTSLLALAALLLVGLPGRAEAATRTSRWNGSAGRSATDHRNPRFRLALDRRQTVTIDLSSSVDAFVTVTNADATATIAGDDDGGDGTNSRLVVTLDAGRYLVVAGTKHAGERGRFTVRTSAGSLSPCFIAYEHASYGGASTVFCEGGEGMRSDDYSSLRVPHGMRVRLFEHSDQSGFARTYFEDTPFVGPDHNDRASAAAWGSFDTQDFYVLTASDPQFSWGHCSDDPNGSRCAEERRFFGDASEEHVSRVYNENLVRGMNRLGEHLGAARLVGAIVNGDLTEFGAQGPDLDDYVAIYERGLDMNVYLGLGNHDYDNNVDDCAQNGCASTMVRYLADQVWTLNPTAFDYSESGVYYQFPTLRKRHEGSLGYSWDVGDVHFVQLNNHPAYSRSWSGWNFSAARRDHFEIRAAMGWLREDLRRARAEGKAVILNLHDWGAVRNDGELRTILDQQGVSAVFAGHWHGTYGRFEERGPFSDGQRVPVFLSGSAHYGTFLVTRFTAGRMYVWVFSVDHYGDGGLRVHHDGIHDVSNLGDVLQTCAGCPRYYTHVSELR